MRKGFFEFDMVVLLFMIGILAATVFVVYRIFTFGNINTENFNPWLESCNSSLEQLSRDMRFGKKIEISEKTLEISTPEEGMTTYSISDKLIRRDSSGKEQILMTNLKQGLFSPHPNLSGLVTVLCISQDPMDMPFFTSFSLRRPQN